MLRITSAAGFGLTTMFGVAFACQTAGIGPIVAAVYVTLGTVGGGTVGWFFGSCISCQSPCPCCCHAKEADDLESQKIVLQFILPFRFPRLYWFGFRFEV